MAGSIASPLLLLLNMAGALLAPRAPQTQSLPSSADDGDEVDFCFFPFLVLYKSGRVQRFMGTDTVPASVDPATGVSSKDVSINDDAPSAGLAVRIYLPAQAKANGTAKLPLVVFYHGGGFVTESAFSPMYQRYLNALASKAGVLVVSVDYHLSPEHRLPAGYDDAWAALQWALRSARSGLAEPWLHRHADLTRLFLIGDSAGGNIAHNMAMRADREGGLPGGATIEGIALLDPYFWGKRPVPSETRDPEERRMKEQSWSFICAGKYGADDPVINPVAMAGEEWRRHLTCARVLVTVAGLDVLSARGRAYVRALRASGWAGEVELYETPGENHVYFLLKPDGEKAAMEMEAVVAFINGRRVSTASGRKFVQEK
ncbi:probable carboxylesterase 12 [Brachypodium distachyon]|uniref:Alpha/beta hydrolase fold-3 domain-containing protein n=1 Tax=Brachypodium distachyon TaxID=15368 RepID=I1I7T0_BRADI|nr:probable carboxylesterase 12 [Brachypodium distachyon]KQJ98621.1 hypothetical protein BRADI_3g38080v3 [Brachypodium distachyon]|eukprot:XP_003572286.1 probable carboxylesterase 12 [Brachypodium distachyon]